MFKMTPITGHVTALAH